MKVQLYLPSNNLSYDSSVHINTPLSYDMHLIHSYSFPNPFEYYYCIVNNLINKNTKELFLNDFYFLWFYIQFFVLTLDPEKYYTTSGFCDKCKTINSIRIHAQDINYQYVNTFHNNIRLTDSFEYDKIKINFGIRKVKHNLQLTYTQDIIEKNYPKGTHSSIPILLKFILSGIDNILYDNQPVEKQDYGELLLSLKLNSIYIIFNQMIKLNAQFGLSEKVHFKCLNCKQDNEEILFNDIILCNNTASGVSFTKNIESIYSQLISIARYRIGTISDIHNIPFAHQDGFYKALDNTKFVPTMGGLA